MPEMPASSPGQKPRTRDSPHRFTLCAAILKREKRKASRQSRGRLKRNVRAYTSFETLSLQPLRRKRAVRASGGTSRSETSHTMLCTGSDVRKWSRPADTPSSKAMRRATSAACATTSGLHSASSFRLSRSAVSPSTGQGAGPTPARFTISPHMNWSPKNGQMRVGSPLRRPAAVVPAPPWWTTAQHCGSSQSCGHGPTSKQSGESPTSTFDQQDWTSTRRPLREAASLITAASACGYGITIEPKPMKMGLSPRCSQATSGASGVGSKAAAACSR
mmetsp:Transcript_27516/g.88887  ORF Transcript_27516/g.88887 Transcript_27516/m.88887 type:complete len:275 (-) Transcript_27516:896-1720(-)|eukprot:scaffold5668_cov111-Isochrysis_galbana.AAC.15